MKKIGSPHYAAGRLKVANTVGNTSTKPNVVYEIIMSICITVLINLVMGRSRKFCQVVLAAYF